MADEVFDDAAEASDDKTLNRRRLLKAAVGTGVAAAAYSAPAVTGVPAYALTVSPSTKDNRCYGIGWSSNNPDGKGWMKLDDQQKLFDAPVYGPDTGPSEHAGDGVANYSWNITGIGPLADFALSLTTSGCVNNGAGPMMTFNGLPAGYCVKFYNGGQALVKDAKADTCGNSADGDRLPIGNSNIHDGLGNPVDTATNGVTVFVQTQGETNCDGSGLGKIKWVWDVKPCS